MLFVSTLALGLSILILNTSALPAPDNLDIRDLSPALSPRPEGSVKGASPKEKRVDAPNISLVLSLLQGHGFNPETTTSKSKTKATSSTKATTPSSTKATTTSSFKATPRSSTKVSSTLTTKATTPSSTKVTTHSSTKVSSTLTTKATTTSKITSTSTTKATTTRY